MISVACSSSVIDHPCDRESSIPTTIIQMSNHVWEDIARGDSVTRNELSTHCQTAGCILHPHSENEGRGSRTGYGVGHNARTISDA